MGENVNQYQSVGGKTGSSKSQEKWDALQVKSFSGLNVLDLGCNEGFFIGKSLECGAGRAVGVDLNEELIAKAREHIPGGEFVHSNWEDYLDNLDANSFDVVIMLSALHYSKDYIATLRKISRVLKAEGQLILECSVDPTVLGCHYIPVTRGNPPFTDTVYHFTRRKLHQVAEDAFFIRYVNKSVMQPGDPIPRFIYNLHPKKPFCLLVTGKSGSGKTALTNLIGTNNAEFEVVSLDHFILALAQKKYTELGSFLAEKNTPGRIDILYSELLSSENVGVFVDYVVRECPGYKNVLIEGAILDDKNFRGKLVSSLENHRNFIVRIIDSVN